jgi:hypothetical protein
MLSCNQQSTRINALHSLSVVLLLAYLHHCLVHSRYYVVLTTGNNNDISQCHMLICM